MERPDGENSEMDREWWADERCDPWKEGVCPSRFTPLFNGTLAVLSSHSNTLSWCCASFVNPGGTSRVMLRSSEEPIVFVVGTDPEPHDVALVQHA